MKGRLTLLGGIRIDSPSGLQTRPTTSRVREAVINIIGNKISNSNWLDLCSGSGVMGCEALLRGASTVVAVELNKKTAMLCKANLFSISEKTQQSSQVELINSDVIKWLKKGYEQQVKVFRTPIPISKEKFDIVYFDPPYSSNIYSTVLKYLLVGGWLKRDSLVICEISSRLSLEVSRNWTIKDKRVYGHSSVLFLNPNLAKHSHADTDSKH